MARAIALTAGTPVLTAALTAVCVALSSPVFAQDAGTPTVPTSTVINGQINLATTIADVQVTYDDGDGVDATAAAFANDFTGVTRGSTLDLESTQTNEAGVTANTNVSTDFVAGYVGASSVAIANRVTAGSNFAGSDVTVEQTNNAETNATTTLSVNDGYGLTNGNATAIGNSATVGAAGYGNPAPLNATNTQTNNATNRATVNMSTGQVNASAFATLNATAIGNTATYGADF